MAALAAGDTAHCDVRERRRRRRSSRAAGSRGGRAPQWASSGRATCKRLVDRLGQTLDVRASLGAPAAPPARGASDDAVAPATCALTDASGTSLPIVVAQVEGGARREPRADRPDDPLRRARVDRARAASSRSSSRGASGGPIAELAAEARKVASGEARPLRVRGAGRDRRARAGVRHDARGPRRRRAGASPRRAASRRGARSRGASPTR